MGLDMMLFREQGQTNKETPDYDNLDEIGYWRKFNALHNWFVINVQDGLDNCELHKVTKSDLLELYQIIFYIYNNQDDIDYINANFEPQSGFFFGSIDIDEYFFIDIKDTLTLLEAILEENELTTYWDKLTVDPVNFETDTLYYQSSW